MTRDISADFLEMTQYRHMGPPDQQKGRPQPPLQWPAEVGERFGLTDPRALDQGSVPLRAVIEQRRSLREFADEPLTLDELGHLLWATQGIRRVVPERATFRTVPSAGARHAFETLVLANRVDGLPAGLYRYLAIEHELVGRPSRPEFPERLTEACHGQTMVAASAATFIWVADRYRMFYRYGERGMRYLHLDAGHACQNLYLAAESIGAGTCAIGAFFDEKVNGLLGFDGFDRFVIYLAPVGKRPADR